MHIPQYFYWPNPLQVVKVGLLIFLTIWLTSSGFAQDSSSSKKDSVPLKSEPVLKDSLTKDSISLISTIRKLSRPHKKDSSFLPRKDSLSTHQPGTQQNASLPKDSVPSELEKTGKRDYFSGYQRKALSDNPYFNFTGRPMLELMQIRKGTSSDAVFYFILAILFYFALVKLLFGKYLNNLFRLFFRISLRQQQIREQVLQTPLPSLLLNIFFIVTAGLYSSFLLRYYHIGEKIDFWLLSLDCAAILCGLYLSKFLVLKFSGWIFNIKRATDTYIFIIFLANKIFGIFLLPFLLVLAFSGSVVKDIMVTLSMVMAFVFFVYRFLISFNPIRKEIKVNGFHFFLYLCAFEVAPLLLIYKVLLTYLEKAY